MDQDAIPPGAIDAITRTPWVIQVLAVVFVAGIILQAAPGLLGRYQDTVKTWTEGRRRTTTERRDNTVQTLTEQIQFLQAQLDEAIAELHEVRRYQRRHDWALTRHAMWDRDTAYALIDHGGQPEPRPPLWPDDDDEQITTGHGTA